MKDNGFANIVKSGESHFQHLTSKTIYNQSSPKGFSLLIKPVVSIGYIKLRVTIGHFPPSFPCFWNEVCHSGGQISARSICGSHLTLDKIEKSCMRAILKCITFCTWCWSKMQNPVQGTVLITFIMLSSGFPYASAGIDLLFFPDGCVKPSSV